MNFESRQSFLGDDSAKHLSDARVAIVGLCGGGSHVAQQLAHIGVGNFTLFDFDKVEVTNLNRMVGSTHRDAVDATPKTVVISSMIERINPSAHVNAFFSKWEEQHERLRECDAVFGCVDSFLARDQLEKYCRRFLIPYFDIGMDVTKSEHGHTISGQIVVSLPGSPCMRCLGFLSDRLVSDEVQRYGVAGSRPQVIWPNGVLASTAVGLFVRMISPWRHDEKFPLYLEYDGNEPSLSPSRLLQFSNRACRHFSEVTDIGDIG